MHGPRVLSLMKRYISQHPSYITTQNRRAQSVCCVRQLVLRGDLRCPPRHCRKVEVGVLTRALVNPTPSHRACLLQTAGLQHILREATGKTSPLHVGQKDCACTRWMWLWMENSPDKWHAETSAAAVLWTLVPGSSSALLSTRTSFMGVRTDRGLSWPDVRGAKDPNRDVLWLISGLGFCGEATTVQETPSRMTRSITEPVDGYEIARAAQHPLSLFSLSSTHTYRAHRYSSSVSTECGHNTCDRHVNKHVQDA
jgi:hypothetical protein